VNVTIALSNSKPGVADVLQVKWQETTRHAEVNKRTARWRRVVFAGVCISTRTRMPSTPHAILALARVVPGRRMPEALRRAEFAVATRIVRDCDFREGHGG
jgi:hypothetical protein